MGVSENRGTLFWGPKGSYYLGYSIRVPYFRKPSMCEFRFRVEASWFIGLGFRVQGV